MSYEDLATRTILTRSIALLRRRLLNAIAAVLVLTALGIGADLMADWSGFLTFIAGLANLCFLYDLTKKALDDLDLLPGGFGKSGLMSLLGLQILSTIAIGIGFLFLLVPGIYLMTRLFLAVPILLAEEGGVGAAIKQSWEETDGRVLQILPVIAVIYVPMLLATFTLFLLLEGIDLSFMASLATNLVMNACFVLGWYAAVVLYGSGRRGTELVEVFA